MVLSFLMVAKCGFILFHGVKFHLTPAPWLLAFFIIWYSQSSFQSPIRSLFSVFLCHLHLPKTPYCKKKNLIEILLIDQKNVLNCYVVFWLRKLSGVDTQSLVSLIVVFKYGQIQQASCWQSICWHLLTDRQSMTVMIADSNSHGTHADIKKKHFPCWSKKHFRVMLLRVLSYIPISLTKNKGLCIMLNFSQLRISWPSAGDIAANILVVEDFDIIFLTISFITYITRGITSSLV